MDTLTLLLLIAGAVFFFIAMLGRWFGAERLIAAGLFCWILTLILTRLD